ncbi:hypothetical protein [Rhizobium sp. Leaf341]|uniref:hypothetical protein n=1 Tax=Rhizobium sp. Leaf341 TaxID=1736344 RepID=UPI0007129785|nr:hypothetical protein [Rhizobium sp. Leaf341]KQR67865.1 hypothetical protein ASG03_10115 [Rhizobium sp. Leaf341]
MAAPQQSTVPVYKETSNIPNPNTAYFMHDARDTPGAALGKLLGVSVDALQKQKQLDEKPKSQMEQDQLAALATVGAEKDRLKLAGGQTMFGVMKDPDASMDSYEVNRGRRDADLWAGKLRDEYAASGLADNDDPKAFQAFVQSKQKEMFDTTLKDVDPSYYHGFLTRVSSSYEDMGKAHAGNLDTFITAKNKMAMESRIGAKVEIDMATNKETSAFGQFMTEIMGAESGNNYNAFHGNGSNQSIRFTDMSIGDVLKWQSSGEWKRLGGKSSAVGKYQIIESTLKDTVRASGIDLDTKFTPAVQDKLIMFRLFDTRKMADYLDGKISDEDMVDKHLAAEFAGLKTTSGKGMYDGDGLNKASLSARRTIAALQQFKAAYMRDPATVVKKTEDGKLIIGGDSPSAIGAEVENAESEFGLPQTEVRNAAANAMIKMLEADPTLAERDDLEDVMANAKLSRAERDRVHETRDRLREENSTKSKIAEKEQEARLVAAADKYVQSGDQSALQEIRQANPDVYQKLLALSANPAPASEYAEGNAEFTSGVSYEDPETPVNTMRAYSEGKIDKATYAKVMKQYNVVQNAKDVLDLPGVDAFVSSLEQSLPASVRKQFKQGLATVAEDLREQNEGRRPSVTAIMEEAQKIHGLLSASGQSDQQKRMAQYE